MKNLLQVLVLVAILASVTTELSAQPKVPTNLTASKVSWFNFTLISLKWQGEVKNSFRDMSYFNIYRKDGAISDSGSFKKIYKKIMSNTWYDKDVQKGATYSYYVTASDHSGESKGSDTVEISIDSASAVKAVIAGMLKDQSTGSAIAKGHISVIPVAGWDMKDAVTDSTGAFSIKLTAGTYIIYYSAQGYIPAYYSNVTRIENAARITVAGGDSLNYALLLSPKVTPKKYALSGSVKDSLGNPLKAQIDLYNVALNAWSRMYYHAVTDSSGNYSVNVKSGDTLVVYAHTLNGNYIPQFYNGESTFQTADRIGISSDVSGINFVLLHKPVYDNGISGTVMSSDSVGVPSIVQALLKGDYSVRHRYAVTTDSLGNYSFSHMNPGQYILLAIPQNGYKPTFFKYDGTTTLQWKNADSVVVASNGTVTGLNFFVSAITDSGAAIVHGHIKDNSGSPVNGAFVYATDDNQQIYSFGISDDSGNYTISGLIPGNYSVTSQLYGYDNTQSSSVSLDYSSQYSTTASFTLTPEVVTGVSVKTPATVINSFALNQNYPNPFNPTTSISYQVPSQSRVVLKIYNMLGKEVATLVNENKAAGSYSITFNAGNLSSGIYFCQMRAGNFVATKKLVLLK